MTTEFHLTPPDIQSIRREIKKQLEQRTLSSLIDEVNSAKKARKMGIKPRLRWDDGVMDCLTVILADIDENGAGLKERILNLLGDKNESTG